MEKPQLKIDIKNTTPVVSEDGNQVFAEGVILKKVSKFISGTPEDALIPIPCFFDVKTGKVLVELLPLEIQEEFKIINAKGEPDTDKVVE